MKLRFSHYLHFLLFFYAYLGAGAGSHAHAHSHLLNETDHYYLSLGPEFSRPVAVLIVILVFVFFIIVFFSVYLRHYVELSAAASDAVVRATGTADRFGMGHGLDPDVIRTFPVLAHSLIKDMKFGKWSLECAVCLTEFQGCETLRLLPKCGHVFHPSCIDAWLASAATCPICRAVAATSPRPITTADQSQNSASQFVVTINVEEDADDSEVRDYLSERVETQLELRGGSITASGDGEKSGEEAGRT